MQTIEESDWKQSVYDYIKKYKKGVERFTEQPGQYYITYAEIFDFIDNNVVKPLSILSPDRETSLETAVKFHKEVAEEAINEQARLVIENEKLRETNQELTNFLSAIQHERNKNELH